MEINQEPETEKPFALELDSDSAEEPAQQEYEAEAIEQRANTIKIKGVAGWEILLIDEEPLNQLLPYAKWLKDNLLDDSPAKRGNSYTG